MSTLCVRHIYHTWCMVDGKHWWWWRSGRSTAEHGHPHTTKLTSWTLTEREREREAVMDFSVSSVCVGSRLYMWMWSRTWIQCINAGCLWYVHWAIIMHHLCVGMWRFHSSSFIMYPNPSPIHWYAYYFVLPLFLLIQSLFSCSILQEIFTYTPTHVLFYQVVMFVYGFL